MDDILEVKLESFKMLRKLLNEGHCPCPAQISAQISSEFAEKGAQYTHNVFCPACRENFHFIDCKEKLIPCPCLRLPTDEKELYLRLDEYIEELKEAYLKQLKKELKEELKQFAKNLS